jgi:hypothetical protein
VKAGQTQTAAISSVSVLLTLEVVLTRMLLLSYILEDRIPTLTPLSYSFEREILRSTCRDNSTSWTKLRDLRYYCVLGRSEKGGAPLSE